MVHRTLTPFTLTESEQRTHVAQTPELILARYRINLLSVQAAPAAVGAVLGDRVYMRVTGFFAVLVHVSAKKLVRPRVFVGRTTPDGMAWNSPQTHVSFWHAALDAGKLVQAFSATLCGGD